MSKSCSLSFARSSMRGTAYAGAISMPSFGPAMPTKSTAAVSLKVRYACTGIPREPGHAAEVARGGLAEGEVRLHRDAARARPFLRAEQHAGGAVGERRAVARG